MGVNELSKVRLGENSNVQVGRVNSAPRLASNVARGRRRKLRNCHLLDRFLFSVLCEAIAPMGAPRGFEAYHHRPVTHCIRVRDSLGIKIGVT
jgi:hypothetical protein